MGTARSYGQKHAETREEVEEEIVITNTVELANVEGMESVNEDSDEELLQSHGDRLAKDEIRELAEQRIQNNFTASDAEEETPLRKVFAEFLSNKIVASQQIMDQFIDNDPDHKQTSKAK